ncbi:MAG: DNA polymerase III subunit gamma/tau [Clostridiales bacterium]|nr:DNA polymerase III subunit gamma/tau [Clostridiales bacterium]
MAHQAIYRKWRPMIFEDIIGQGHITQTLKNQILTDKVGHAYLFCGTRGTGKTTCAKVFSRAVNCLNNHNGSPCNECEICKGIIDGSIMDVTEIDAASNNGVDDIRGIKEDVNYVASLAKYTVYIIDEVHMLSGAAFNALLKTLEEPPEHVIFILATTEPHKVPQTILSRCQRFDFKRIKNSDIIVRMKEIAHGDGLTVTDDAYEMLAALADGSMRDGLSYLERVAGACTGTIGAKEITAALGLSDADSAFEMTDALCGGNVDSMLSVMDRVVSDGKDLRVFIDSLIKHLRDLMVVQVSSDPASALQCGAQRLERLKAQSKKITFEKISHAVSVLCEAHSEAKWVKSPRVIYELALIKITKPELDRTPQALMDRLSAMEHKIEHGVKAEPDESLAERVKLLEDRLKGVNAPIAETAKEEKPAPKPKRETLKRLYNPIPEEELNGENPIVKAAKNWSNAAKAIVADNPPLGAFLRNRSITIDRDGIILIYKRDEGVARSIVTSKLANIQKSFAKFTGQSFKIKVAVDDELSEDNYIDFWNLPAPAKEAKQPDENVDPLDTLTENFPEIVDVTDDREFLEHNFEEDSFSQSNFGDKEEFLEQKEMSDED